MSDEFFTADEYRLAARILRARFTTDPRVWEERAAELDHAQSQLLESLRTQEAPE